MTLSKPHGLLTTLLSSAILLSACQQPVTNTPKAIEVLPQSSLTIEQITTQKTTQQTEETTAWVNPDTAIIKGNHIYCRTEKVGTIENGRIYMKLYGQTVSFAAPKPDFNTLICEYDLDQSTDEVIGKYLGFSYDNLEISTNLYPPYSIYQVMDTPEKNHQITYKCDGSLAKKPKNNNGADAGIYTKNVPYFYCKTNGKDYLTQYELQSASGYPVLTTGGDYGDGNWDKIYIKKNGDLNYIFRGKVSRNYEDYSYAETDEAKRYEYFSTKKFLDYLLKKPENTGIFTGWQKIVDSFQVETGKTID